MLDVAKRSLVPAGYRICCGMAGKVAVEVDLEEDCNEDLVQLKMRSPDLLG